MTVRKVMIVSEHPTPLKKPDGVDSGGQNRYVSRVAHELVALGYQVDVVTRRDNPTLPEVLVRSDGVRTIHVTSGPAPFVPKEELLPLRPAFTEGCLRWLRRKQYDVVHANFYMSGMVAAHLKRIENVPFVVTFHAVGKLRRPHPVRTDRFFDERFAIEQRVLREADRILAESPQDYDDLVSLYHTDPSKLSVVPCAVSPTRFTPISKQDARTHIGGASSGRMFVRLGRSVSRVSTAEVIQALALPRERNGIEGNLIMVDGEFDDSHRLCGDKVRRLRVVARAAGLPQNVQIALRKGRSDLRHHSIDDRFITTPWLEPCGITPLHAMARGMSVVVADDDSIRLTVRDGVTGTVVLPKAPSACAAIAADQLCAPERIAEHTEATRERDARLFTWDRVARQIAAVYHLVVEEGRKAPQMQCAGVLPLPHHSNLLNGGIA